MQQYARRIACIGYNRGGYIATAQGFVAHNKSDSLYISNANNLLMQYFYVVSVHTCMYYVRRMCFH